MISPGRNSAQSDDPIETKVGRAKSWLSEGRRIESIKMLLMCKLTEASVWNVKLSQEHSKRMVDLLTQDRAFWLADFSAEKVAEGSVKEIKEIPSSLCYSRGSAIRHVMDAIDSRLQLIGFSRMGTELTDVSLDENAAPYYEKEGVKIIFSSEAKNCSKMFVGVYRGHVGNKSALDRVIKCLPEWESSSWWCWHQLSAEYLNWNDEFLMFCERDRSVLELLTEEILGLIKKAYTATKRALG